MSTRQLDLTRLSGALLTAAPLLLAGSCALAHGTGMNSTDSAAAQRATEIATPPRADIKPFEGAKLSLTQAISDAEKETRGTTLAARFEIWHGQPSYLIRTYTSNEVWDTRINADTGQPMGEPASIPRDQLSPQLQKDVAALPNVQTSLTQAVSNAEQKDGGKAILASVHARSQGSVAYKLDLVKNNRLHVAMVDAQTGQLR